MVHSKPEYAESVKLLTFSQLKRLEKMDAKKAREEKLLDVAKSAVDAGGRAAEGLLSNQIIGTIAGALLLLQFPQAWENAGESLVRLAADVANAVKSGVAAIPPPLIQPEGTNQNGQAPFCIRYQFSLLQQPVTACYPTIKQADDAYNNLLSEHAGKVWKLYPTGALEGVAAGTA